jgi:hypothetical protein
VTRIPEHRPNEPAATTGLYREVNVFGTPTGKAVRAQCGERLPLGPHGFGWQLVAAGLDDEI